MFDQLWEESPRVQKMREDIREKITEEIRVQFRQEELQAFQRLLVNVVRARYPDLAEFAQQQVSHFDKPDALELLIQQLLTAPNASTARWLLESGAEKEL